MNRVGKLIQMVSERRIGFKMDEVMRGTHSFEPGYGPEGVYPMEFKVTWGPKHISRWLNPLSNRFMRQGMEGDITVGELCQEAPCIGNLKLDYFGDHMIEYNLQFSADGKSYLYVGEKMNVKLWEPARLLETHASCYGRLFDMDGGDLVSCSITKFNWRELPEFLASFRFE